MSTFKGKKLKIEIFGNSHDEKIGAKVFGMPKTTVDLKALNNFLERRKPNSKLYSTTRQETDIPIFENIKDGRVDGEFSFSIKNEDINKKDYNNLFAKPRPSHADYAWYLKDNVLDFSGGGRFSGRLTAPLCVIGYICKQVLKGKGIDVLGYVSQVGSVKGVSYKDREIAKEEAESILKKEFPAITNGNDMIEEIIKAKNEEDSVGGRIECIVYNMTAGTGDNLFGGLEGKISSLLYSIPAVKGVEFGCGFDFCAKRGSQVNDQLEYRENKVCFIANNNGGINGGISNGEQITIGVAVKPTPSIAKEQRTIDLERKENTTIKINGRHDSCIVSRVVAVVESAVAIALVDEMEI